MILDKYIITTKDQLNVLSLLVYTDVRKCNLDCWKCHNKNSSETYKFLTKEQFKELTQKAQLIGCELCIVSGGEPTINDLKLLSEYLKQSVLPVRVDTNGTQLQRVRELKELTGEKIVGFALDIKVPLVPFETLIKYGYEHSFFRRLFSLHTYTNTQVEKFIQTYITNVTHTLEFILKQIQESKLSIQYSLTRTVLYDGVKYGELVKYSLDEFYKRTHLPRITHMFLEFVDETYKFTRDCNIHSIVDTTGTLKLYT